MINKNMRTLLAAILCFAVALVQVNISSSKSLTNKSTRFSHHDKRSHSNRHTVKRNAQHKSTKRQFLPFYGGMDSSFNHHDSPPIHRIVVHHHPGKSTLSFSLMILGLMTSFPLTSIIVNHVLQWFYYILSIDWYYLHLFWKWYCCFFLA